VTDLVDASDLTRDFARDREDLVKIIDLLGSVRVRIDSLDAGTPSPDSLLVAVTNALQTCHDIAVLLDNPWLDRLSHSYQRTEGAMQADSSATWEESLPQVRSRLALRAAPVLEASKWSREMHAALQLPASFVDGDAQLEEYLAALRAWRTAESDLLPNSAALLLAELGEWDAVDLARVASLLTAAEDLFRYRARAVLAQKRLASMWGREHLETLAELAVSNEQGDDNYLVSTTCGWALTSVSHDSTEWLAGWIGRVQAGEHRLDRVLSSIHGLAYDAWPSFRKLLNNSSPREQALLLTSTGWLLRLGRIPKGEVKPLCQLLLSLADKPAPVGSAALDALGHMPKAGADIAAGALLARQPFAENSPAWFALARLAHTAPAQQKTIDAALAAASPGSAVNLALARRIANGSTRFMKNGFYPSAAIAALAALRPNAHTQLAAWLAAAVTMMVGMYTIMAAWRVTSATLYSSSLLSCPTCWPRCWARWGQTAGRSTVLRWLRWLN
jgi:hypothetical protein